MKRFGLLWLCVLLLTVFTGCSGGTVGSTGPATTPTLTPTPAKTVITIGSPSVAMSRLGPVSYIVTYQNASTITLTANDVTLIKSGTANGTITVFGSGNTRTVTVSVISGDGSLAISLASGTAVSADNVAASAAGPSASFNVANAVLNSSLPAVRVSGTQFVNSNNAAIRFKMAAIADPEVVTINRALSFEAILDKVVEDGLYNGIRLMVKPDPDSGERSSGMNANPDDYINRYLKPSVDAATARNLYVIIDLHYIADYDTTTAGKISSFWTKIATLYKESTNVLFEIYNEPVSPDNWVTWVDQVAQPVVNTIRAIAPNIIIIGGPRWDQNIGASTYPVNGENIAYAIHVYPEQGSNWEVNYGTAANTVPLFVTEWGYMPGGPTPLNGTTAGFGQPFMDWMETRQLSWSIWVYDSNMYPNMFVRSGSSWVKNPADVNQVIYNYVPTPPKTGKYAITQCKSNSQYFSGLTSTCTNGANLTSNKLIDVLQCVGVTSQLAMVKRVTIDFEYYAQSSTCAQSPNLSTTLGGTSGIALATTSSYGCRTPSVESYSNVVLDMSSGYDINSIYFYGDTGDWCSSFAVKNIVLE